MHENANEFAPVANSVRYQAYVTWYLTKAPSEAFGVTMHAFY